MTAMGCERGHKCQNLAANQVIRKAYECGRH